MTTEQANIVLPASDTAVGEFDVIGTRPIRHDGPDKVTGRARYAADIHPPGLAGWEESFAVLTPTPVIRKH